MPVCTMRGSAWPERSRRSAPQTDQASAGEILIAQRLYAEVEDVVEVEPVGELTLAGFQRPVATFNVVAVREPESASAVPASR